MARRKLLQDERLRIAASQGWTCGICSKMLPPAFEIDHVIELADNGADTTDNMQALCGSCHNDKTQKQRIKRLLANRTRAPSQTPRMLMYDERSDWVVGPDTVRCDLCLQTRKVGTDHPTCPVIEKTLNPSVGLDALEKSLGRFRYKGFTAPKGHC